MKASARVQLGRTPLRPTSLGLGTAPLAGLYRAVDEEEGMAVIDAAWKHGLRFFDTAPLYGSGLAERRLGKVLRSKPRDEFVLATKVGRLLRADAPPEPGQSFRGTPPVNPVFDFSYDAVMRSLDESLARMEIDRVDVVHIHDPDDHYEQAIGGAYPALDNLRKQGVITAVGAGMNQSEMLTRFARDAAFDCFLLAGRYTLLEQGALDELLPVCLANGISIIAGGVFNSGILGDPRPGTHYNYQPAPPHLMEKAQRLRVACERHGVPLRAAAIQFPLGHPAVQTVVVGCRSVEQLEDAIRMFETDIPPDLWDDLKRQRLIAEEAPTPA